MVTFNYCLSKATYVFNCILLIMITRCQYFARKKLSYSSLLIIVIFSYTCFTRVRDLYIHMIALLLMVYMLNHIDSTIECFNHRTF